MPNVNADLVGLTEPQHAVLQLLADGLTLKEMGKRLGPGSTRTSGATTQWYRLHQAMKTLGAATPEQAIAIGFRRGILR